MRILVLCTGASCRSQMACGYLRTLDERLEVHAAGSRPAPRVNPNAIRVMNEAGVDLSSTRPLNVAQFLDQPFDYVVTVCANAERECPAFTGPVGKRLHIGFDDPADAQGAEEDVLAVFRRTRDDIRARFFDLYTKTLMPELNQEKPQ